MTDDAYCYIHVFDTLIDHIIQHCLHILILWQTFKDRARTHRWWAMTMISWHDALLREANRKGSRSAEECTTRPTLLTCLAFNFNACLVLAHTPKTFLAFICQ